MVHDLQVIEDLTCQNDRVLFTDSADNSEFSVEFLLENN